MHFQEEKMENLKFYVDQNAPKTKFDHYWEKCVGACHAYTALREDYRRIWDFSMYVFMDFLMIR